MDDLAPCAAEAVWRHHTAREAVEVVHVDEAPGGGWRLRGHTTGAEDEVAYALAWEVVVGSDWVTRTAHVRSLLPGREAEVLLERSEAGDWTADGAPRPELAGVVDVDLEASAVTNTLPVHREALDRETAGSAAYVRLDLTVELLEQWYGPAETVDGGLRVRYRAPRFGADLDLTLDAAGMVLDYPGLATRIL
jgi:hypothetical protein